MNVLLAMLAPLAVQAAEAPTPPPAVTPGTVAVQQPAAPAGKAPPPELPFAEALTDALAGAGFTPIPGAGADHARYVASFEVKRVAGGAVVSKGSGATVLGGGLNGGVSVGLGGSTQVGQLVATELTVRLTRRGESAPAWEGRAVTQQIAGSRGDAPAALAAKLAGALFRNFPQPSGLTISVP